MYLIILSIFLILAIVFYKKLDITEGFENIPETIGNYLSAYVYNYSISICEEKDFYYKKSESDFLKYLMF